jgi:hypothetical protein
MAKYRRTLGRGHVATLLLGWALGASAAQADPIEVGSGENQADVVIEFSSGAWYEFDVFFDGTTTGLGLFDIIEFETDLETVRLDFGFGEFIDGIIFDGHSDVGFGGGENWWHYWTREVGESSWTASFIGAADRTVTDGDADGWVYGNANPPVPEPTSAVFAAAVMVVVARRKGRDAQ